jgi:hypothetical protein
MTELLKPTQMRRCERAAPCNAEPCLVLGRAVATPAALALLSKHGISAASLLARHSSGDWGDVGADSAAENAAALQFGGRILSSYRLLDARQLAAMTPDERRRTPVVWVITEGDRSSTCVLCPSDY